MKAKDLIKILEQNPEMDVKFYNSFVDDWMDIQVDEFTLVKEKPSFTLELINWQNEKQGLPLWDSLKGKNYQKRDWQFQNMFTDYNRDKKNYSFKKVFLLQGKKRGITTFDRLGKIKY